MIYLTLADVPNYCSVSVDQVALTQANIIIETYLGDIGEQQKVDEKVSLNRSNKGKLQKIKDNIPLVSIDSVKGQVRTPFGISEDDISTTNVDVDPYGYLVYYPGCGLNQMIFGGNINTLLVTYTYGYSEPPEDLKFACAAIAMNIAKRGTYGFKGLTDFDVQLQFLDDSIITSDIRMILNKYRGV